MSEPLDSASAAWVTCPQCATRLPSQNPGSSQYFGCHQCRAFFWADPLQPTRPGQRLDGFKRPLVPGPSLPLGVVGTLGGYRCRLTGYQVRGEKDDRLAEWREYQLRPAEPLPGAEPFDLPLQLAEYQGHWLLIRRAPRFPGVRSGKPFHNKSWRDATTGRNYQLWHRYQPVVRDALGEFDWNILEDERMSTQEFTAPPYLLVSEQRPGTRPAWYLAEHLEPTEVAAAFYLNVSDLPAREGVGAAQPAPVPGWEYITQLSIVVMSALVLLQTLLVLLRPVVDESQNLLIAEPGPEATSQMLVSRSFNVQGPAALAVTLEAPDITNHWVELTASLVNEQTGRGYEFTRSLEYYEGVEDGESWREGDRTAEVVLSAVPSGRYHFNFYPTVDKGTGIAHFTWRTEVNTVLWSNFWLVLGLLGLVPAVVGWRHRNFERERWEGSNFSPYDS
ncbi:hypothetical protein E4631_03720 [Hymenobacter sp. UV11]|uniref:hypothetical protein n=1 Tax=Hymenobacter sp. UV11 TaxID=1849735 RepID=UPI00105EFBEB|nr:hypothetical protein [Hymenobacter sp. UV11]TDN36066.1 hypothetical protein A8B98_11765 [Hymenobacter sp. UV11]TFZ68108.1 hypothetical protein E4631_03720 [Hymenobacter sp. UV11]